MNKRYLELLAKYHANKELYELLELVRLDYFRVREDFYNKHNRYPEERELIGKLIFDLKSVKELKSCRNK